MISLFPLGFVTHTAAGAANTTLFIWYLLLHIEWGKGKRNVKWVMIIWMEWVWVWHIARVASHCSDFLMFISFSSLVWVNKSFIHEKLEASFIFLWWLFHFLSFFCLLPLQQAIINEIIRLETFQKTRKRGKNKA